MIKSFKGLMARIPTCVGVIVYESSTGVSACTISSFVSISVENGHEEIIFTLRRASNTGDELKKLENFSISILKSDQSDVAKLAGSNLPKKEIQELLLNNIERNSDNVLVLNESFITFVLKFKEAFSVRNSEIYVCQVLSGEQTPAANHLPMVYFDREFTTTQRGNL
jgi:flavin reductase (DIM6/NTAB) family NADH-FMN oxidoreductase RutF